MVRHVSDGVRHWGYMQAIPGFVTLSRNIGPGGTFDWTPPADAWVWHSLCSRGDALSFFNSRIKPLFPAATLVDRARNFGIVVQSPDPTLGFWNAVDTSDPDAYMEEALGSLMDREKARQLNVDHAEGDSLLVEKFSGIAQLYWGA